MNYDNLTTLGSTVREFKGFDTFPAPENVDKVVLESDELTGVCPITGQPDWYTIIIEYVPDKLCLESKSLKLYLQKFRNEGIFGEALSGQIVDDIFEALSARSVSVNLLQKPRGGISIRSIASRIRDTE